LFRKIPHRRKSDAGFFVFLPGKQRDYGGFLCKSLIIFCDFFDENLGKYKKAILSML
jgi:hypothetical protein